MFLIIVAIVIVVVVDYSDVLERWTQRMLSAGTLFLLANLW